MSAAPSSAGSSEVAPVAPAKRGVELRFDRY